MGTPEAESQGEVTISISVPQESLLQVMGRSISTLEKLNERYGNMFFATLGEGDRKALIFPTPSVISSATGKMSWQQLLVVTVDGFKIVQASDSSQSMRDRDFIIAYVMERMGKNPSKLNNDGKGYRADSLEIRGGTGWGQFRITPNGTHRVESKNQTPLDYRDTAEIYNPNCVLGSADPDSVKRILELNIERVRKIQESTQAAAEVLAKS